MASLKVHCNDCRKKFGNPYKNVHTYLDQYAKSYKGSKLHRHILHNERGIREVRRFLGAEASQAARLHIDRDNADYFGDFVKKFRLRRI